MINYYSMGCAIVATVTFAGMYILKQNLKNQKSKSPFYKCIFLTEDGIRGQEKNKDFFFNLLTPITEFINECQESLDLCFYIISDISMVNAIINAKERNVKVRIITDYNTGIKNNKFAKYFFREGIPVFSKNVNSAQTIMHNKFLIRDGEILLQASLNLTKNTSKGSYDNVMITNDPHLVKPFKEHFQKLVLLFDVDHDSDSNN